MGEFFYFEAQTGTIRTKRPAVTNFYQYRFPVGLKNTIRAMIDAVPSGSDWLPAWGAADIEFFTKHDRPER